MLTVLRTRFAEWRRKTQGIGPEPDPIDLHRRRVFILPSYAGLGYGATLFLLWLGSINYSLSLGFALTFLAAATAVIGMAHTWHNLAHLKLAGVRALPVFAGEAAQFECVLENPRASHRYALHFTSLDRASAHSAITLDAPPGICSITLAIPTQGRGWLAAPRIKIWTRYPLGLWTTWAYWTPPLRCLVYPSPEVFPAPLPETEWHAGYGEQEGIGQDEFAGIREYRPGDPSRHIAWRVAARSDQKLVTKMFSANGQANLRLRLQDTPIQDGLEARIARLTAWVLQADANQRAFSLELPSQHIATHQGPQHRESCLRALALENAPSQASATR